VAIAPLREQATIDAALPTAVHRQPTSPWRARALWLAAVVAVGAVGLQLTGGFPERLTLDFTHFFDQIQLWAIENQSSHWLYTVFLNPIKDGLNSLYDGITNGLLRMTWFGLIVGLASLAGVLAGWRLAAFTAAAFFAMGALGLWVPSVETLSLMIIAVSIALIIGVPLGIAAGRRDGLDRGLRPILDAMQTIPAYSYLLPLVLFFGIRTPTALIATVIFALPPAVRLTSLGIRGVPPTALEVAGSFGSTSRQTMRKVQLPMAKASIMLGVNQTIMMALGMVVIAAIVGIDGLGREVLNGLRVLDVGESLNGGIAIVLMAIVLDRVSYAWSVRDRTRRSTDVTVLGRPFSRRTAIVAAVLVTIAAIVIGREILRQQDFPQQWTLSVADPTNAALDWVKETFSGITGAISHWIIVLGLDPLRYVLQNEPWWLLAVGVAVLGWRASGRWRLAVFCAACVLGLGTLGMWDQSMDTLSQVLVAVAMAVVIAVPLGIWSALDDRVQRGTKPFLDAMQTMPAFVYLVPVIALFQVGRVPGVIASVIYALPPCVRLTDLGIRQVSGEVVEASRSYGSTTWQTLTKVQLPLARPSILLGVNQMIMMALSVVIIAGLIGGGGLGFEAVAGLTRSEIGRGVVAGVSILLLAVILDRVTQELGMARRSMRGPVGTSGGWWPRVRAIVAGSNVDNEGNAISDARQRKGDA
jgi:glycine betaine/proline transport system permease protein